MSSDIMGAIANWLTIQFNNCPTGKRSLRVFSLLMTECVASKPLFVHGFSILAAPLYRA